MRRPPGCPVEVVAKRPGRSPHARGSWYRGGMRLLLGLLSLGAAVGSSVVGSGVGDGDGALVLSQHVL